MTQARKLFDVNKQELLQTVHECGKYMPEYDEKVLEEEFTFEEWVNAVKKFAAILSRDTFDHETCTYVNFENCRTNVGNIAETIVLKSLPFGNGLFFGIDTDCFSKMDYSVWDVFRVVLEAFDDNQKVELDYTDLYEGGYCGETPSKDDYEVPKTIILTEGSTDVFVISSSMRILYPEMVKYYSFIDFSSYSVQGSTNFLTHYLKAFSAAGVKNRIIALYDNDAAGRSEIEGLSKHSFADNICIMHLPDLEICNSYPTLGPNGRINENINGRACSIEMFLGKSVLTEDGEYIPIRWKGYNDKIGEYQGEIIKKEEVLRRYDKKVNSWPLIQDKDDWKECDILLNQLFNAFIEF